MRIIPPTGTPSPSGGGVSRPERPSWLIEWLANQGRYVRLSCGHSEDLNDKALLIIGTIKADILCIKCEQWVKVVKPIRFTEHIGFPPPQPIPDEPLF